MSNVELYTLFPTIIYKQQMGAELTAEEHKFINNVPLNNHGLGNSVSKDTYLLDNKELKSLKESLTMHLNQYLNNIMHINNELYITNSWLNLTTKHQEHQLHSHSNSILSGVFYINTSNSQPQITFSRLDYPFLLNMKATQYHAANSIEWNVPVFDNDVIIFPSKTFHAVLPNLTDNERISIAFNSFVKGTIGADSSGADLTIN
tara:strand:+ start:598 stop:1209 length:612 start_codon:yes stop_codon:yes gene_type:complete